MTSKEKEIEEYKSKWLKELVKRQALEEKIREIWFFMKEIAEPDA
jgi:hypothetical protein